MKILKISFVFWGIIAFLFVTSCIKENVIKYESASANYDCNEIELYDYDDFGSLHNEFLSNILLNASLDSTLDLTMQLDSFISEQHVELTMNEFALGDPWADFDTILDRTSCSTELKSFIRETREYLYHTDSILNNQEYQTYINTRVALVYLLSNSSEREMAYRALAVLSHSIAFWLPTKYCGQNGYSLVFDVDLNTEVEVRRSWLTNFADIYSHDLLGALCGGWSPPTAIIGLATMSAGRALGLAWDGGY